MGIRTPDLLHAMPADSVRLRRSTSDFDRSGWLKLYGCVGVSLVPSDLVVTWLVTGFTDLTT